MRRVPLETNYYEAYNQDNVLLMDISETPTERIARRGIKTSDTEYGFDMIIDATSFDGVTGGYGRGDIRGPAGRRLKDWADGLRAFLGPQAEGFPNRFMLMGPPTAHGNIPRSIAQSVEWLTDLMCYMREHHLTRVEPRPDAMEAWTAQMIRIASMLLSSEVNSWQTSINRDVAGKNVRRVLGHNGGARKCREKSGEVAAKGYQEFAFDQTG